MLNKVKQYMESNRMLSKKKKVVLGVSGGADSVCLFFVLLALRDIYQLELHVVHVNHMIRGEEADADQRYVEKICMENNIPFHCVKEDVKRLAKEQHLSEEEAGRDIRYLAFERVREEYNCDVIAVAHNSNDCAETMLFQLVRGSGLTGLTGIPAIRDRIIRPLLCVTRTEIEQYLDERGIPYQTDATNLETDYTRNKIRLHVLPYIEENINSNAIPHIVKSAQMLKEVEEFVEKQTNICYNKFIHFDNGKYYFNREGFLKEDIVIQKTVVRKILRNLSGQLKDIESIHIEDICTLAKKGVGKKIDLPYSIVAYNDYKNLILTNSAVINFGNDLEKREELYLLVEESTQNSLDFFNKQCDVIELPSGEKLGYLIYPLNEYERADILDKKNNFWYTNQNAVPDFAIQVCQNTDFYKEYKKSMINIRNGYTKCFDYDKIKNAVQLRTRREGDYMQIGANGGTKKIKSIFIDKKIPLKDRNRIPLLADGSHIMWILGSRISEAYKINESTKTILIVYLFGGK
ncbi:tRNA lysidine(34) synthetase TilS [Anaerosporobacter sp.]